MERGIYQFRQGMHIDWDYLIKTEQDIEIFLERIYLTVLL